MKSAARWTYAAVLAASALAWLRPDFARGLLGEGGLNILQGAGIMLWAGTLVALMIMILIWWTTPPEIRRVLWRHRQF